MNQTTLYLDLMSTTDTSHHAALAAADGTTLAQQAFEYRLDGITILTELERFDPTRGNPMLRRERIQAFGQQLYCKVFSTEMHAALQQALREHDWLQLVVRIETTSMVLARVPWEFLYDGSGFLAADEKIGFRRCLKDLTPSPLKPLEDDTLRILCLVSSPLDLPEHQRLAVEWEQERLLQALDSTLSAAKVEIEFEDEATLQNLEAALDEGHFHILHYTGHGSFHPNVGGSLILEDEQGKKSMWAGRI